MVVNPIRRIREARMRRWTETQATVESCIWVHDHDNLGNDTGHFDVFFVYRTPGSPEPHHGKFCCQGCQEVGPYRPGEKLPIRYNRNKPGCYRFPWADATSNYEKLEAILVVSLFALAAGYALLNF
jgi:hypothetical protein